MKAEEFWWKPGTSEMEYLFKISMQFDEKYLLFDMPRNKEKKRYDSANNCAMAEQVWAIKKNLSDKPNL